MLAVGGNFFMSATITLPVELEGKLAKKAAVEGVNVEQFAIDALRRVAEMPSISELLVDDRAEFAANGRTGEKLQQDTENASASKPVPQVRRSTRGVTDHSKLDEWLRQNRDKYRGQWVVLDGDRLVGHAATTAEATVFVEQARAEGVRSPFVQLIPLDDEPIWMLNGFHLV
jgi:hypothetical protein